MPNEPPLSISAQCRKGSTPCLPECGGVIFLPQIVPTCGCTPARPRPLFLHHRGRVLPGLISTHVCRRLGRGALFCARSLRESRRGDGGRKPDQQSRPFARNDHAHLREASLAIIPPRGLGGGAVLGARRCGNREGVHVKRSSVGCQLKNRKVPLGVRGV